MFFRKNYHNITNFDKIFIQISTRIIFPRILNRLRNIAHDPTETENKEVNEANRSEARERFLLGIQILGRFARVKGVRFSKRIPPDATKDAGNSQLRFIERTT